MFSAAGPPEQGGLDQGEHLQPAGYPGAQQCWKDQVNAKYFGHSPNKKWLQPDWESEG